MRICTKKKKRIKKKEKIEFPCVPPGVAQGGNVVGRKMHLID